VAGSQSSPGRGVVVEEAAPADVLAHLLEGPVPGLLYDGSLGGAAFGREVARPERSECPEKDPAGRPARPARRLMILASW
jgi:hypothetical protein